jgi:integrase
VLTDLTIKRLPAPEKGVRRYWDKDGLCLQVSQGGTKTFYYVHGDDRRFVKLGRYPRDLSLAQARESVAKIHARRALGIEEDTSRVTVQEAIERFSANHCDARNKPRTAYETKRLLTYLGSLSKRRMTAIDTRDLLGVIEAASDSVSERRHVFAASRVLFRWAVRQRLIKASPLQDVQAPGLVVSRDRVLSDEEMAAIYKVAVELGHPYGYICLIAIHTGMRRGEVSGLKWSYITDEAITLPAALTKNKREHVLPNLINENLALIPKTKRADGEVCEYLFPSSVGTPYSAWSDGKKALDDLCGVEGFVFHDFRRYLSTTMAKLRVPIDVTEAILNHVSGSRSPLQRIYDRHNRLPEMREALELYEKHLSKITGGD